MTTGKAQGGLTIAKALKAEGVEALIRLAGKDQNEQ